MKLPERRGVSIEILSEVAPVVLSDLRENYTDTQIESFSVHEAMNAYLEYNGIICFTADIIDALDSIRKACAR